MSKRNSQQILFARNEFAKELAKINSEKHRIFKKLKNKENELRKLNKEYKLDYKGSDIPRRQKTEFNLYRDYIKNEKKQIKRESKDLREYEDLQRSFYEDEIETEQKHYNRNLLLEQLENIPANQRYLLTYIKDGRRWYVTLDKQDVIDNIINKIREPKVYRRHIFGSDPVDEFDIDDNDITDIEIIKRDESKRNNDGKYFPYYNLTEFDLSKYQIYNKKQRKEFEDKKIPIDHCLYHTFKISNLCTEDALSAIKNELLGVHFPKSNLKKLATKMEVNIRLTEYLKVSKKMNITNIKSEIKTDKIINIALYNDHYFLNDIYPIHLFSIDCRNDPDWLKNKRRLEAVGYRSDSVTAFLYQKKYCQKAIAIVKRIMETNGFEAFKFEDHYKDYQYTESKNYTDNNFPILKEDIMESPVNKKVINKPYKRICFADFETTTDGDKHKAFMCCCSYADTNQTITFTGAKCSKQLLEYLEPDTLVYFHNLKYDWQQLQEHLYIMNECVSDGQYYEIKGKYFGKTLTFRDSYKMISMPLRDFAESFQLTKTKEIMPYSLYTENNSLSYNKLANTLKDKCQEISKALECLKYDDRPEFIKKIDKLNIRVNHQNNIDKNGNYFRHLEYCKYYCKLDVNILKQGMQKFMELTKKELDINIYDYLTISSLAHNYFINKGCYDGVHEVIGSIRNFVQQSIVGGRVCTKNDKKHIIDEPVQDFDAVGLYGSAMVTMKGFPKGLCKIIKNKEEMEKADHYIVEIKIIKGNNINYDIPMMSSKEGNENRNWVNNMDNTTVIVDKITLEDYVKYYNIEYEFIKGIYWDEGFNTKMSEEVYNLLELRKKYKAMNNPLQLILKLIVNSAYGKTIQKEITTDNKYMSYEAAEKYIDKNFNMIKIIEELNNQCKKITVYKNKFGYRSLAHCGGIVLSNSKKIMNEVNDVAFKNDIPIFYVDTDSMHMLEKDVDKLKQSFQDKFDRELVGKNVGQFHCDFSVTLDGKAVPGIKDIKSIKSIILGKKCYYDKVRGTIPDGSYIYNDHIRMKGISNKAILYKAKEEYGDNVENLMMSLYNGDKIGFDLCSDGGVKFEYIKGGIKSKKIFIREIQFN
jgi:hypothetical protein